MNNIKFLNQKIISFNLCVTFWATVMCVITGCKVTPLDRGESAYNFDNDKLKMNFNSKLVDSNTQKGAAITQKEKIMLLDKKLEESVAKFDKMFAVEISEIETEKNKIEDEISDNSHSNLLQEDTSSSKSQSQSDVTSGDGGDKESTQGNNYGETIERSNSSAWRPIPSQGGMSGKGSNIIVPEDIPNGEGDDIIARQIREAAVKEQDPELREKLWEEYRKYKGAR